MTLCAVTTGRETSGNWKTRFTACTITAREEEIDGQQVDDLLNDSFYDDLVIDLKKS